MSDHAADVRLRARRLAWSRLKDYALDDRVTPAVFATARDTLAAHITAFVLNESDPDLHALVMHDGAVYTAQAMNSERLRRAGEGGIYFNLRTLADRVEASLAKKQVDIINQWA